MLKKIQNYLLVQYPTLWNTRLIPMLFVAIALNAIVYYIGYLVAPSVYEENCYNLFDDYEPIFFALAILSLLTTIGWLVHYSRNNALSSLYPRKTRNIYTEWLFCFIILTSVSIFSISLYQGSWQKWKLGHSNEEIQETRDFLQSMKIFRLDNMSDYEFNSQYCTVLPLEAGSIIRRNRDNRYDYSWKRDTSRKYTDDYNEEPAIATGFKGNSLLFYGNYYDYQAYKEYQTNSVDSSNYDYYELQVMSERVKEVITLEEIKGWLKNGDKDKVRQHFEKYNALLERHGLGAEINVDQWIEAIFQSPYLEVTPSMIAGNSLGLYNQKVGFYENYGNDYKIEHLQEIYRQLDYAEDRSNIDEFMIVALYFAVCFSLLLYSFRASKLGPWIAALIGTGILSMIIGLLVALLELELQSFLLIWIIIFVAVLSYVIHCVANNQKKKGSQVLFNMLVWYMPAIVPIIFVYMAEILRNSDYNYENSDTIYLYNYTPEMLWASILFVLLIMYPIASLTRKFRATSE